MKSSSWKSFFAIPFPYLCFVFLTGLSVIPLGHSQGLSHSGADTVTSYITDDNDSYVLLRKVNQLSDWVEDFQQKQLKEKNVISVQWEGMTDVLQTLKAKYATIDMAKYEVFPMILQSQMDGFIHKPELLYNSMPLEPVQSIKIGTFLSQVSMNNGISLLTSYDLYLYCFERKSVKPFAIHFKGHLFAYSLD